MGCVRSTGGGENARLVAKSRLLSHLLHSFHLSLLKEGPIDPSTVIIDAKSGNFRGRQGRQGG